jgi:hypothetical protein
MPSPPLAEFCSRHCKQTLCEDDDDEQECCTDMEAFGMADNVNSGSHFSDTVS